MQVEEIWDASYRHRTFRFTGALPQSLHEGGVYQGGEAYIPERARVSYIDEGSKGIWRGYVVDVEGYHSVSMAPVFLNYHELVNATPTLPNLGWLPAWLQPLVAENTPGKRPDEPDNAPAPERPQHPGPMPEFAPLPVTTEQATPIKFPEVRSLDGTPVKWGATRDEQAGTPETLDIAVTKVLPIVEEATG